MAHPPFVTTPDAATAWGALAAVGAAVLAWLGTRMVGRAALETALTATAKEMLDQLRTELRVAIHERDKARALQTELQAEIEALHKTILALELRIAAAPLPRSPSVSG